MRRASIVCICAVLSVLFFASTPLFAAGPLESVQTTTQQVMEILSAEVFNDEEQRPRLIEEVSKIVKKRFDWEAIARGSLSIHWRDLSRTQQEEFTELFGDLMERTYLGYLDDYSGEEAITYVSEEVEATRARIIGKFITKKKQEIPVEYRMWKKDGEWLITDVLVEGVSLVRNYRVQFNEIMTKSSYEELIKRIKEKLDKDI